jgi:predicted DNA-binding protein
LKNLNKLYWLKKEVTQIENQIRELTILSAFEMSGMPSSNSVSSPVEKFYDRLDKLRTKLEKAKEKVVVEKERLESYIENLEDAEIRVLARARYLECKTWEVIGDENHMDRRTASRKLERYFGKDDTQ